MLTFGSDLIARDVSSSKNVVAWTISREWLAYADDQFYLLIRAKRPYDFAQPQQDIARLPVTRGDEKHHCVGMVRMSVSSSHSSATRTPDAAP